MKFIIIITILIILKLTILGFLLDHFSVHRIKENNDTDSNNSNEIISLLLMLTIDKDCGTDNATIDN